MVGEGSSGTGKCFGEEKREKDGTVSVFANVGNEEY